MKKSGKCYKKATAVVLTGVMLSLTAAQTVLASTEKIGPGYVKQVPEETAPNWVWQEDGWYYLNPEGVPAAYGWIIDQDRHYFIGDEGKLLVNTITPDGYFVDANGEWYQRTATLLGEEFCAPKKFPALTDSWAEKDAFLSLRSKIRAVFANRKLKISDSSIEYVTEVNEKEQVLMGIYKMSETNSYRFDISVSLDPSSTELNLAETYDYMVFRAMLYQISSTPDHLERAIYSSWEDNNQWNIGRHHWIWIGDSWLKYTAIAGSGHYYVAPVNQE